MQRTYLSRLLTLSLIVLMASFSVACAKATLESQTARYQRTKDSLEVLGIKTPALKADIAKKVAEFDAELATATAKGGEAAVKAIGTLVYRMDAYQKQITPAPKAIAPAAPAADAKPVLGDKLKPAAATATEATKAAAAGAAAVGAKLKALPKPVALPGGKLPTVKVLPTAQPIKLRQPIKPELIKPSGFGAKPVAVPAKPVPVPVKPVPAKAGNSGFGGK